jgi:hypothetical protein
MDPNIVHHSSLNHNIEQSDDDEQQGEVLHNSWFIRKPKTIIVPEITIVPENYVAERELMPIIKVQEQKI